MTVEYYIQSPTQYSHEQSGLVALAQQVQRALAPIESCYILAANVRFWQSQADALILSPHAIILIELKACGAPVYGREQGAWRIGDSHTQLHGGNAVNPYQQINATRQSLIKYLDRNRRRFLLEDQTQMDRGHWGHVSAALIFTPYLHPSSDIVIPSPSQTWLSLIGLNEIAEFIFTRTSPKINLRPAELRRLAVEVLGCRPWSDLDTLLSFTAPHGYLWLLDEAGRRTYAFPVQDGITIGRSRENVLVIPRRFGRVSRLHARLRVAGDTVELCDHHSTHGAFINGGAIPAGQSQTIHDGDTITLGSPDSAEACTLLYESKARAFDATSATQQ